MRPLICPQCGGQIDEYTTGATFTVCQYCGTRFLIEENKIPRRPPEPVDIDLSPPDPTAPFVKVLASVIVGVAIVGLIALVSVKKATTGSSGYTPPTFWRGTPTPVAIPSNTPDTALFRFGSQGTEDGQFDDATAIAVDKQGSIYVGDGLRVQQFDNAGKFIRSMKVPAKGRVYERAHTIEKLAVASDGRLFVGVGGVILVYGQDWKAPRTIHVAPDYIQDFVVKADGYLLAVSTNDRVESLLFINKNGGITRRLEAFHTDAINASASPLETAAELVRIAVDPKGDIFSVYALSSAGSYSLSYNDSDLAIAHFTADAKFVKSFPNSSKIVGLVFDAAGRLNIAADTSVIAYDEDGNNLGSRPIGQIDFFTVDGDGNIYTITNNTVAKFPPVG